MIGPFAFCPDTDGLALGQVTILHEPDAEASPCLALVDWRPSAPQRVPAPVLVPGAHVLYPAVPREPSLALRKEAERLSATVRSWDVDATRPVAVLTCRQAERLARGEAILAYLGEGDPLWPRDRVQPGEKATWFAVR